MLFLLIFLIFLIILFIGTFLHGLCVQYLIKNNHSIFTILHKCSQNKVRSRNWKPIMKKKD